MPACRTLRLAAFVIAGAMAGIAGGLFCLFNAMATPDILHWGFSARPVLMTVLGGSGIFFGPLVRGGDILRFGAADHRFDGKLDDLSGADPDTGGDLFPPRHPGHIDRLDSNKDETQIMSDTPILKIENLGHSYGKYMVIQDISLEVAPGELTALIGPQRRG